VGQGDQGGSVLNLTHTSSKAARRSQPPIVRRRNFGLEAAIKFENLDAFGGVGQTASRAVPAPPLSTPAQEVSRQLRLSAREMRLGPAQLYLHGSRALLVLPPLFR
jgi:hypothetical protein